MPEPQPDPDGSTDDPRRWWVLAAMGLPLFVLTIDGYGITVALPAIGRAFGAGTTELQWVVNGFTLALVAPLIAFGRLGDIVGRRRILLVGLLLFGLGSALCAAAGSMGLLIAGRCVQGFATALFSTIPMAIVAGVFRPERRGLALAIWAAAGGAGSAIGPLACGALTHFLSWRWFFLINLGVAALAMLLILAVVDESRDETAPHRIDMIGFTTITAGLAALVFGLQLGDDRGWGSPAVLAGLSGGSALILAFAIAERRVSLPLIDLALFRRRGFPAVLTVALTCNFGFSAILFFSTLYLQNVLGLAPLGAGMALVAFSALFVVTLPLAGGMAQPRLGPGPTMALGMGLMTLAFLLFQPIGPAAGLPWVLAALGVAGIGQGLAFNTVQTAAMNAVPDSSAGAAAGAVNGAHQVGSVLGIALGGAVFQTIESRRLLTELAPLATLAPDQAALVRNLLSGSEPARATLSVLVPQAARQVDAIVARVFDGALHGTMLLCAAVSLVGVAAALRVGQRAAGPTGMTRQARGRPSSP